MAEKKIRMSAQGLEDLQNQLEYLKNVRRKEVAEKLKEARSQGDLSENAEYVAAKDEQGLLEAEIADIEKKIELADPENNKISEDSPLGVAALKKKVGDTIEVEAPKGIIEMKILEISK